MRIRGIFRWYDFWIGLYWDRRNRHLYVFPVPMMGLRFAFPFRELCHRCGQPAVMQCVRITDPLRYDRARDPLCDAHGKLGPCPDSTENFKMEHQPMPAHLFYYFED